MTQPLIKLGLLPLFSRPWNRERKPNSKYQLLHLKRPRPGWLRSKKAKLRRPELPEILFVRKRRSNIVTATRDLTQLRYLTQLLS